jgi:hypothetical protein
MRSLIALAIAASAAAENCVTDEASSLMQLKVPQAIKPEMAHASLLGMNVTSVADRTLLLQKVRTLAEKIKDGKIDDETVQALDGAISTAASVLREQALPAVQRDHDANVAFLDEQADSVHACATSETFGQNAVERFGSAANTRRGDHQTCRSEEHVVHEEQTRVCDDWTAYINDLAEPPCPLPDRAEREQVVSHLEHLERYAEAHTHMAREKMDQCHELTDQLAAKRELCNEKQTQFENSYCVHRTACRELSHCRAEAEAEFERVVADVATLVAARKIEYTTISQIQCFLDLIVEAAHGGAPLGEDDLQHCADDVDTSHLDIATPELEPITPCDADMMGRSTCSADFFSVEYAAMPQHETVEGRCIECAGDDRVGQSPTLPSVTSPPIAVAPQAARFCQHTSTDANGMGECCNVQNGDVAFHPSCSGAQMATCPDNDHLSHVVVPEGCVVTLWQHCQGQSNGQHWDITEPGQHDFHGRFNNDDASAATVYCAGSLVGARGFTTNAPNTVDGWQGFSEIDSFLGDSFPSAGQVTGFKWYGSNPTDVRMGVWRPQSGNTHTLLGQVTCSTTNVGGENTCSADIAVQAGDVLGWTFIGQAAFGFDYVNLPNWITVRWCGSNGCGGRDVGQTMDFPGTGARRYHVAAIFTPSV